MTQSEFADLVGVTQQAVSDLVKRGVLRPNLTAATWLREYCAHLREEAAGRAGTLADASAALKIAQRQEVELRLAIKRRQYVPLEVLQMVIGRGARKAVSALAGLPPKIHRRWPTVQPDQMALIEEEIARARNAIASMSIEDALKELDGKTTEAEGPPRNE